MSLFAQSLGPLVNNPLLSQFWLFLFLARHWESIWKMSPGIVGSRFFPPTWVGTTTVIIGIMNFSPFWIFEILQNWDRWLSAQNFKGPHLPQLDGRVRIRVWWEWRQGGGNEAASKWLWQGGGQVVSRNQGGNQVIYRWQRGRSFQALGRCLSLVVWFSAVLLAGRLVAHNNFDGELSFPAVVPDFVLCWNSDDSIPCWNSGDQALDCLVSR